MVIQIRNSELQMRIAIPNSGEPCPTAPASPVRACLYDGQETFTGFGVDIWHVRVYDRTMNITKKIKEWLATPQDDPQEYKEPYVAVPAKYGWGRKFDSR